MGVERRRERAVVLRGGDRIEIAEHTADRRRLRGHRDEQHVDLTEHRSLPVEGSETDGDGRVDDDEVERRAQWSE